jgi:hypothetical protein
MNEFYKGLVKDKEGLRRVMKEIQSSGVVGVDDVTKIITTQHLHLFREPNDDEWQRADGLETEVEAKKRIVSSALLRTARRSHNEKERQAVSGTRQRIKGYETTVERWKENRVHSLLTEGAAPSAPKHIVKAVVRALDGILADCGRDGKEAVTLGAARKRFDAEAPELWEFMPPPKNEDEWESYFNDLLNDCVAEHCLTDVEVLKIIGYDTNEFEAKRGRGCTFLQAFTELLWNETPEQRDARTKYLTPEQRKERLEHAKNQMREGQRMVAKLENEYFKETGINLNQLRNLDE